MNISSEICNFAYDSTIYTCGNDILEIVMVLGNDLCKSLEWLTYNGMAVNPNQFQLTLFGLKWKQKLRININGVEVLAKKFVKPLGVEIDNELKFVRLVEALYLKVNKKTSLFARLNIYISREQALSISNVVILSNFNHCPLIWLQ